eukprot:gene2335-4628_t
MFVLVSVLFSTVIVASRGGPMCTPNPDCTPGGIGPSDPEPGCKACVAPDTSYNCAACCPGYNMTTAGTVKYCTRV